MKEPGRNILNAGVTTAVTTPMAFAIRRAIELMVNRSVREPRRENMFRFAKGTADETSLGSAGRRIGVTARLWDRCGMAARA
jgi:hypothetical protein